MWWPQHLVHASMQVEDQARSIEALEKENMLLKAMMGDGKMGQGQHAHAPPHSLPQDQQQQHAQMLHQQQAVQHHQQHHQQQQQQQHQAVQQVSEAQAAPPVQGMMHPQHGNGALMQQQS